MKAAYILAPGTAESIQIGELPKPEPTDDEVLVRVRFSAVNPIDVYVRSGAVAMDLPRPFIPGCDFAGVVESASGDRCLTPGTRVWGCNQGLFGRQGALAEYVAVGREWLYPTPKEISDEKAAAGALVGITSHLGLVREARVQPGETILVNGGAGGVGSTVVQMAKALGARVIASAGSEEKRKRCQALGADLTLDYRSTEFVDAVKHFAPEGVNVYWETSRAPDFDRIVALLADRGRAVLMAGRDARPEFPVGPFYVKECRLLGFALFKAPATEQRVAAEAINHWQSTGDYRPTIGRIFPLDQAAAAHRLQEENTVGGAGTLIGKIVVQV